MDENLSEETVIKGRVDRKASNALRLTFEEASSAPVGTALQGGGAGKFHKLGVLFGFRNGGVGQHLLTCEDGAQMLVHSRSAEATVFTRSDGSPVATVERGDTSAAILPDGSLLFRFIPDPDEAVSLTLYRMIITDPSGGELGRLDVVRRSAGLTSAGQVVDAAINEYMWFDHAGRGLKVPLLGTLLTTKKRPTAVERDILLGACVDLAIGLRPYTSAMR